LLGIREDESGAVLLGGGFAGVALLEGDVVCAMAPAAIMAANNPDNTL